MWTPASKAQRRRRFGPAKQFVLAGLLLFNGSLLLWDLARHPAPEDVRSYREVDLRYRDVRLRRGRGSATIHLDTPDGRRYRFPETYWPEDAGGRELVAALEMDSVATAWVAEGGGYPVVKGIRTSRLDVDPARAVPIDRRRRTVAWVFSTAFLLAGLGLALHALGRIRVRPPAAR